MDIGRYCVNRGYAGADLNAGQWECTPFPVANNGGDPTQLNIGIPGIAVNMQAVCDSQGGGVAMQLTPGDPYSWACTGGVKVANEDNGIPLGVADSSGNDFKTWCQNNGGSYANGVCSGGLQGGNPYTTASPGNTCPAGQVASFIGGATQCTQYAVAPDIVGAIQHLLPSGTPASITSALSNPNLIKVGAVLLIGYFLMKK